jgi:hypothetical protein
VPATGVSSAQAGRPAVVSADGPKNAAVSGLRWVSGAKASPVERTSDLPGAPGTIGSGAGRRSSGRGAAAWADWV